MDRSQLIHVVGLVGAGTGIHEREHSCYEKSRLMMCDRIWSGKNRASLTVLSLAICKEERIGSRIIMPQFAGLTDEAALESHTVLYAGTA